LVPTSIEHVSMSAQTPEPFLAHASWSGPLHWPSTCGHSPILSGLWQVAPLLVQLPVVSHDEASRQELNGGPEHVPERFGHAPLSVQSEWSSLQYDVSGQGLVSHVSAVLLHCLGSQDVVRWQSPHSPGLQVSQPGGSHTSEQFVGGRHVLGVELQVGVYALQVWGATPLQVGSAAPEHI
jgi:hypothetical protein